MRSSALSVSVSSKRAYTTCETVAALYISDDRLTYSWLNLSAKRNSAADMHTDKQMRDGVSACNGMLHTHSKYDGTI